MRDQNQPNQKQESYLSFLDESDDDDDELLKPTFLSQQSARSSATVDGSPSSSPCSSSSQDEEEEENAASFKKGPLRESKMNAERAETDNRLIALLEKADQQAREAVDSSMDLKRHCDLSEVRWHKSKKTFYPVVLASKAERNVPSSSQGGKNLVPVLYLGHSVWGVSWSAGMAYKGTLLPYYEASSATELEDHLVWNPKLLEKHLNALRTRKEFQDRTEYKLQLQRSYLKYALMRIRDNQGAAIAAREEQKDKVCHSSLEGQHEEFGEEPQGESSLQGDERADLTHAGSQVSHDAFHNDKPQHPLRAGDVVQFIPPTERAEGKNKRTAIIVKVNCKRDDIALELSDGTLLPPDHSVSVRGRWLRGELKDHADKRFYCVNDFRLDPSLNNKLELESHSSRLASFIENAQRDVQLEYVKRVAEAAGRSENVIKRRRGGQRHISQ